MIMNASDITNVGSDRFSWKRVWMLAGYVFPGLKKQLIFFPILSLLAGLSLVFAPFDITSICASVIFFAYILSPIGLANKDFKSTIGMLPVKASEKFTFLVAYFWLVVPLLLYLPLTIIFFATQYIDPVKTQVIFRIYYLGFGMLSWLNIILCQFMSVAFQTSVMLVVINASANRTLKGIVMGIGVYIGFIFLSAVSAGVYFGYQMVNAVHNNPELESRLEEEFRNLELQSSDDVFNNPEALEALSSIMGVDTAMGHFLNHYLTWVSAIAILGLIVELVLIFRKLKKGGF